jgi:hypothetical protein
MGEELLELELLLLVFVLALVLMLGLALMTECVLFHELQQWIAPEKLELVYRIFEGFGVEVVVSASCGSIFFRSLCSVPL